MGERMLDGAERAKFNTDHWRLCSEGISVNIIIMLF